MLIFQYGLSLEPGTMCYGTARRENSMANCLGVPGAPLVTSGKLMGLLSWGLGCGYNHDLPLIYTSIKHHMEYFDPLLYTY